MGMRYLCSFLLGQFSSMMADRHLRHTSVLCNAARCVLSGLYGQMKSSVKVGKGEKAATPECGAGQICSSRKPWAI